MKKLISIITPLFSLVFLPNLSNAANCISIAGQNIDPSSIYDSRHQCGTCAGQAAKPALCGAINRVMVPYWSASADLVTIPHRGFWGRSLGKGASENTLAAAKAALNAGHRIIEMDAALTGPSNSVRKVFLGHYFSMSAAGGPAKTTPHHLTPAELVKFKMRKRDQSLSFDEDDHLPLLSELLTWAMENQVLLMIDPKTPGSTLAHEHDRIIAYSLNEARTLGALANVAIKNVNRHNWTLIGIKPYLDGPFSDYDGQFLWSPIVNKSMAFEKDETLASINSWHKATQNSKQVITYETSLYNPTFWAATPFVEQGKNYLNLIDYVKQLTPLGKRSAVWSIDPVGDKGTLDREYRWKFSGNSDKDKRGNPFRNISYELGRHVVINTDRPDWYEQMVVNPY